MATAFAKHADPGSGLVFDELLHYRQKTDAALSATTRLNTLDATLFNVANQGRFTLYIDYDAVGSHSAGTNEWTITVEGSATGASGFVTLAEHVLGAGPDTLEIPLSGGLFRGKTGLSDGVMTVNVTKSGAAGDLTFLAVIAPDVNGV